MARVHHTQGLFETPKCLQSAFHNTGESYGAAETMVLACILSDVSWTWQTSEGPAALHCSMEHERAGLKVT